MNRIGKLLRRSGLVLLLVAGIGSAAAKGERIVMMAANALPRAQMP